MRQEDHEFEASLGYTFFLFLFPLRLPAAPADTPLLHSQLPSPHATLARPLQTQASRTTYPPTLLRLARTSGPPSRRPALAPSNPARAPLPSAHSPPCSRDPALTAPSPPTDSASAGPGCPDHPLSREQPP
jgi:hypothetical protein